MAELQGVMAWFTEAMKGEQAQNIVIGMLGYGLLVFFYVLFVIWLSNTEE